MKNTDKITFGSGPFQFTMMFMLVSSLMSVMPLTNGLAFLEKTPSMYECKQVSATRMSDLVSDHK